MNDLEIEFDACIVNRRDLLTVFVRADPPASCVPRAAICASGDKGTLQLHAIELSGWTYRVALRGLTFATSSSRMQSCQGLEHGSVVRGRYA